MTHNDLQGQGRADARGEGRQAELQATYGSNERFCRLDRIERVEQYERLFDKATARPDPQTLRLLDAYYTSGEWREDYEADERGEFPPDLKRGVLSQDALYDLLEGAKP